MSYSGNQKAVEVDPENLCEASIIRRFPVLFRRSDDEGDLGLFGGDVGGHADPEVVAVVALGGGVDDGGAVHVGGDDGAGLLGGEAGFIDDGAVEDPGVEVVGGFTFIDVLDEVGEGDVFGFVAVFPFDVDGEAVGSWGFGLGVLRFVGALGFGFEFFEDAEGGGLVVGEEEGELDLDGLHLGFENGLVDFFACFMAEGVLDGQLLMEDGAGDAELAGGGIDLDAVEIVDAGGDLLDEFLRGLELCFGVWFRCCGLLRRHAGAEEEGKKGGEWAQHGKWGGGCVHSFGSA